ncbi:MAG: hypothetical protein Q8M40_04520 [Legionella sp.]|nr:hypothetical protein [Legionella sp.]
MNAAMASTFYLLMILFSVSSYADVAPSSGNSFQSVCIDSWMKKSEQIKDKIDYKNFGEKYCSCAATQPLSSDAEISKAIQTCMSQTLLHDAMDSLEEEVGLSEAKATDIDEYCNDRWDLIYPDKSDEAKKITTAYCSCANPKLMDLIKHSDNQTDKQYNDAINSIAASCSGIVQQPTPSDQTPPDSNIPAINQPSTPSNSVQHNDSQSLQ